MIFFADFAVSEDCININSYGEICVHCGCCSNNPDYRDRTIRQIRYYKQRLKEVSEFNDWDDSEYWRSIQEENMKANILYNKRKIRMTKKVLKTLRGK